MEIDVQKHFTALGHSVMLINNLVESDVTELEDLDIIARNVEHLKIMKSKDFWTDEDFTEVDQAIAKAETYLK